MLQKADNIVDRFVPSGVAEDKDDVLIRATGTAAALHLRVSWSRGVRLRHRHPHTGDRYKASAANPAIRSARHQDGLPGNKSDRDKGHSRAEGYPHAAGAFSRFGHR